MISGEGIAMSQANRPRKSDAAQPKKEKLKEWQDDLIEELPEKIEPAQDRGERLSSPKAVALGGKEKSDGDDELD
jgi:hypothetical protein